MKRFVLVLAMLLAASVQGDERPAELLVLGVFHFANPGLDVVQVDQVDVTTSENQAWLAAFAKRLCAFRPTAILLEFDRSREAEMQAQLDRYRAGEAALGVNERQQIGFRVAKECGVEKVHGIDEREIGWDAQPLFEYLERSEPELLRAFESRIAEIEAEEAAAHRELGLRELMMRANDPAQDRKNKDLYLLLNAAGARAGFEGADATARWWHRNFRMYANIQHFAEPGARILVVAGQGHTAIFRDLAEMDARIRVEDVDGYL